MLHQNSCLLDFPQKTLRVFWREKFTRRVKTSQSPFTEENRTVTSSTHRQPKRNACSTPRPDSILILPLPDSVLEKHAPSRPLTTSAPTHGLVGEVLDAPRHVMCGLNRAAAVFCHRDAKIAINHVRGEPCCSEESPLCGMRNALYSATSLLSVPYLNDRIRWSA